MASTTAPKRFAASVPAGRGERPEPRSTRLPDEIAPAQIHAVRQDLGRQLAAWRKAANVTQEELAKRTWYSRSTIANIETGRQTTTRRFWQRADRELGADGLLVKAFDQVDDLIRAYGAQMARARELERQECAARHEPSGDALGCGCARTVARWGGRETRALREALRMTVRAFAEYLGVTTATVGCWESKQSPKAPRLSTQDVLDQALKLAGADARARFWKLLEQPGDPVPQSCDGATVVDLRRFARRGGEGGREESP